MVVSIHACNEQFLVRIYEGMHNGFAPGHWTKWEERTLSSLISYMVVYLYVLRSLSGSLLLFQGVLQTSMTWLLCKALCKMSWNCLFRNSWSLCTDNCLSPLCCPAPGAPWPGHSIQLGLCHRALVSSGEISPGMRGAESHVKLSRSGIPYPLVLVLLVPDYLETSGLYIICMLRYTTLVTTLGAS